MATVKAAAQRRGREAPAPVAASVRLDEPVTDLPVGIPYTEAMERG